MRGKIHKVYIENQNYVRYFVQKVTWQKIGYKNFWNDLRSKHQPGSSEVAVQWFSKPEKLKRRTLKLCQESFKTAAGKLHIHMTLSNRNKPTRSNIQNVSTLVPPFKYPSIACNWQNLICIKKSSSGTSGLMNTVRCWEASTPRAGVKAPHPPCLVLCVSSIWLFLKCIFFFFFNKLAIEAESWTL